MIETWMKDHLVSDSNYNTVNLQCAISFLQGLAYNVRFTFNDSDTTHAVYNWY